LTVLPHTRGLRNGVAVAISAALTGGLGGVVYAKVRGDRMAPWILGRATGVVSYLLLVALVVLGLTLSHPRRALRGRSATTRMRMHVTLALLTLVMLVLHVVILATDRYAGVGWGGALLPMQSSYRPAGVTLGVVGAWVGVLAGVSAALAGRVPLRLWFPLHRIAGVSFVLVLVHGLLAGSDSRALLSMYVLTGGLVTGLAGHRYFARARAR
jgi:predicted ferric reductase